MPTLSTLLAFAAVALAMVMTPGPNMIYLISRSIAQAPLAGLISLTGVALGFVFTMGLVTNLLADQRQLHGERADHPDRRRRRVFPCRPPTLGNGPALDHGHGSRRLRDPHDD